MIDRRIILTADGSHTFYLPQHDAYYHSVHGAIAESQHVFIDAGLQKVLQSKTNVHILEVGFGTGLNALLTLASVQNGETIPIISYTGVEPYPLSAGEVLALNYTDEVKDSRAANWFALLHNNSARERQDVAPNFSLLVVDELSNAGEKADLVYLDAFAPVLQPELWTVDFFGELWRKMNTGGILVTYCAKGAVRRAMQEAGFRTERLPGPPKKREMLRATKLE